MPHLSNTDVFWISVIVAIPMALLAWRGWILARVGIRIGRARVVPIGSAADGPVAIEGTAEAIEEPLFTASLTGAACVWYRSMVEHLEASKKKGSVGWSKAGGSQSFEPFLVRDSSGTCAVFAHGEHVIPTDFSAWAGTSRAPKDRNPPRHPGSEPVAKVHAELKQAEGSYRYLEQRIYPGDRVFVMGRLTRQPPGQPGSADGDDDDGDELGPGGWPGFSRSKYLKAAREAFLVTPRRIVESGTRGDLMVVSGVPRAEARALYVMQSTGMFLLAAILAAVIATLNAVHFLF